MAEAGTHAVVVLTTVGADVDAQALARTLVEERLAACVSILPVTRSVYRWRDGIEEAREQQLVIKTTRSRLAALGARVRTLHPYELPEWLVLGATASDAYLRWIEASVDAAPAAQ